MCSRYEHSCQTKDKIDKDFCREHRSAACDTEGDGSGKGRFSKVPSDLSREGLGIYHLPLLSLKTDSPDLSGPSTSSAGEDALQQTRYEYRL